jgi:Protein of unknown function (DUF1573)
MNVIPVVQDARGIFFSMTRPATGFQAQPGHRGLASKGDPRMIRNSFVVMVFLGAAGLAPAAPWADSLFLEASKDFGSVPRGPTLQHSFVLKNNTGETVRISHIRVSCSCVTATAPKNLLQPGEEGVVLAQMDTTRFHGVRSVTIYVHFDQPKNEEVRLWVRANGRDDVNVLPETLAFGQVKRGTSASSTVRVTFQANGLAHVTEVQTESNYVQATVREVYRQPSEVAYEVTARMRADAPVGRWFTDVWLKTDNAEIPRVRVPLTVEIESVLNVNPSIVSLGDVKIGTVVERRIIVRGVKPFLVTSVRGTDKTLSVEDSSPSSKPVHVLTVKFQPSQTGDVNRALEIVTDLDGGNSIEVQATGRAK